MRAQHEHPQCVVAVAGSEVGRGGVSALSAAASVASRTLAPGARLGAASRVDHATRRDADQPGPRIVGNALRRPLGGRREQCLLERVLARREVAAAAEQRDEHVRRVLAPHELAAVVGHSVSPPGHIAGRNSTVSPGPLNLAATSSARSRDATSIMKKPANCSFVSA